MINVVTVHWRSAKWIDPQLRYLERNIEEPFRVYAALEGIDAGEWGKFHFAADLKGTHPDKLNALADIVYEDSDPDDVLVFIDGDALPVRPIAQWMRRALDDYPLVAVRRDENLGDPQPHPCFSFTTPGFWRSVGGDWRKGGTWTNSLGDTVTDPGGNLLHILNERGIEWLPLLRTNTFDAHPVWFAVYDHRIYHHGAGFRSRESRVDLQADKDIATTAPDRTSLGGLMVKAIRQPSLAAGLPLAAEMSVAKQIRRHDLARLSSRFEQWDPYERALFKRLRSDPDFFLEFDATPL